MKDLISIDDTFATVKPSPIADMTAKKKANQIDNAIIVVNKREKLNWIQQMLANYAYVSINNIISIENCTNDNKQIVNKVKNVLNKYINKKE